MAKLPDNNLGGILDIFSQGASLVKQYAPQAIEASIKKKIATTNAKAAAVASQGPTMLQATGASPTAPRQDRPVVSFDWASLWKPAAAVGGVAVAALVVPRLLPERSR